MFFAVRSQALPGKALPASSACTEYEAMPRRQRTARRRLGMRRSIDLIRASLPRVLAIAERIP